MLKKHIYAMYKKEMVEEGSKVYNVAAVGAGGDDDDDTPRPSVKAKAKPKAKPKARATTAGAPEPIDDLSRELDDIARGEDGDEGDGGFDE